MINRRFWHKHQSSVVTAVIKTTLMLFFIIRFVLVRVRLVLPSPIVLIPLHLMRASLRRHRTTIFLSVGMLTTHKVVLITPLINKIIPTPFLIIFIFISSSHIFIFSSHIFFLSPIFLLSPISLLSRFIVSLLVMFISVIIVFPFFG